MATEIHPSSLVDKGAELGENVYVGPFCVVGDGAKLGDGTRLISHVSIEGNTTLGAGCTVSPFAALGQPAQDLKYKGEPTALVIGDKCVIRESVTMHRASVDGNGVTSVGSNCFIMAYVHVAHDCNVGDNVIMASGAELAGHVSVGRNSVIGGMTGLHQFVRVGEFCMVGGMSKIVLDVAPYMIAQGNDDCKLFGPNKVGLKRNGFSEDDVKTIKAAYKILLRGQASMKSALKKVQEELPYTEHVQRLVEFIGASKRGVLRG